MEARLTRRGFLRALAAAAAAAAGAGLLDSGFLEVTRLRLGLGVRVAVLADLHLHGPPLRSIAEAVEHLRPRIVVLAGDFVDELTPGLGGLPEWLERFLPRGSTGLAVLGNHEHRLLESGRVGLRELERLLEEAGFTLLVDSTVEAGGLRVAGVDWAWPPEGYRARVERLEAEEPRLVVAHSPDAFHYASRGVWASGHTHGGQVCLPGARSVVTNSVYGYRWGLYRRRGAVMYVSRGLGEMLPPRIYCRRQLLVLE